jgi:hypothetical protein
MRTIVYVYLKTFSDFTRSPRARQGTYVTVSCHCQSVKQSVSDTHAHSAGAAAPRSLQPAPALTQSWAVVQTIVPPTRASNDD